LEILQFEGLLAGPLPARIRRLLGYTGGFELGLWGEVSFVRYRPAAWSGVFACGIRLAEGPRGGFWVVDAGTRDGAWGAVFYVSRRPPVVVVQAADVDEFVEQALDLARPGRRSPLLDVVCRETQRIWREDPYVESHARALHSPEPAVSGFASQVGARYAIVDLRAARVGSGFAYALQGEEPRVRRRASELLFGVERPPTLRVRRWVSRLAASRNRAVTVLHSARARLSFVPPGGCSAQHIEDRRPGGW
jgi:hypothetical protein